MDEREIGAVLRWKKVKKRRNFPELTWGVFFFVEPKHIVFKRILCEKARNFLGGTKSWEDVDKSQWQIKKMGSSSLL